MSEAKSRVIAPDIYARLTRLVYVGPGHKPTVIREKIQITVGHACIIHLIRNIGSV